MHEKALRRTHSASICDARMRRRREKTRKVGKSAYFAQLSRSSSHSTLMPSYTRRSDISDSRVFVWINWNIRNAKLNWQIGLTTFLYLLSRHLSHSLCRLRSDVIRDLCAIAPRQSAKLLVSVYRIKHIILWIGWTERKKTKRNLQDDTSDGTREKILYIKMRRWRIENLMREGIA